jgi:hypothetical protein
MGTREADMSNRANDDIEKRLQRIAEQVGEEWSAPFRSDVIAAIQDALRLIVRLKQEVAALQVLLLKR